MPIASGTFEVNLAPVPTDKTLTTPAQFARMTIEKSFSGGLDAKSLGEMLSCRLEGLPSAGYVAIEQATGTLDGKTGSFVLQHYGVMSSQGQHLTLTVLPDSGTGELTGLTGSMTINIADGQHSYEFDYQL